MLLQVLWMTTHPISSHMLGLRNLIVGGKCRLTPHSSNNDFQFKLYLLNQISITKHVYLI